jgi:hypothetical protein
MHMTYIDEHMRQVGITPRLLETTRNIRCPQCCFNFSLMYSRATACGGCSKAVLGCGFTRCPKCGHEFPLTKSGLAKEKASAKSLDKYMAKTISDYIQNFGKSPKK